MTAIAQAVKFLTELVPGVTRAYLGPGMGPGTWGHLSLPVRLSLPLLKLERRFTGDGNLLSRDEGSLKDRGVAGVYNRSATDALHEGGHGRGVRRSLLVFSIFRGLLSHRAVLLGGACGGVYAGNEEDNQLRN